MRIQHLGRALLGAGLAAVLAVAPVTSAAAGAAPAGGDRRVLQRAADDLRDLGVTGVQGIAADGRRTSTARSGVADIRTGAPVPHDGYFRMGSNTKTFAAVVVLQLVAEGRLSLEDSVERWLPGVVAGNGNDGRRVTVRQLLQHTSGIYNYTNDLTALASPEEYLEHRFEHMDPEELVAVAMKHEPVFAPGTSWDYSNTNYILVGMIIEKITGRSWGSVVRERVTGPLGLTRTYSPGDVPTLPRPHAKAYQQFEPGGPLLDTTLLNLSWGWTAGDLVTTPSDLVRFWQALQSGRLLRPAQLAEMHRTVLAVTFQDVFPGVRYGLGIMWTPTSCGGYWSHGGDVPGISTVNGVTGDGSHAVVLAITTRLAGDEEALAVYRRADEAVARILC
ncbi:serine hydrolase domain-containing protein [Phytohabitans sp. ZYX-F-186]|uniref:Serine hydrolase domain-containing protein n=1 Tax=Phytohabitans maris TaxID=3071409 RepID=A0ABU0ZBQ9_9ACTN|nr:serine hydrolase domain-containing protein [Phytohabitans sp. ZYX-F-186]MDQ7904482.1 serine hydrolase domain-containing protein [Phytohabitans sp. ZYX-F-186]